MRALKVAALAVAAFLGSASLSFANGSIPVAIPESSTFILVGAGVVGLWIMSRKFKR